MADLEASLIEGRPPRYVQLATAAVPDGPDVVERWQSLGRAQAARIGVEAVTVAVDDRIDADNPEMAGLIRGAGLVYLSGGNPAYLAETLRDTLVWRAIVDAWQAGAALAGCSAGAMAMGSWVPTLRHPRHGGTGGLALLPHVRVIPHFDAFSARVPSIVARFLLPHDSRVSVVGVDEHTALVGGPYEWVVEGRGSAWVLSAGDRTEVAAGSTLVTPGAAPQ
jgi:cyanophycinase-like exopeptidase